MQTRTHSNPIPVTPNEPRRDTRRPAAGKVQLKFDKSAAEVRLDLLDVGTSGFRVFHRRGLLPLGANAFFRHPDAAGVARVVWNWRHPDHVETGFVVIR